MRPAPCGYSSACVLRPHFLFSLRKGNGVARQRKRGPRKTGSASRAAIASEEASSIPFPPGRRKLHIRSLLPSQIVTVSLGHNLAIWNFTTPHAILMMAVISLPANTAKSKTSMRRKSRARLWSIEGVRGNHPKGFPGLFSFARRFLFGEAKRKCRPFPLSWKKQIKKRMWTPNRLEISKNSARWRKNTEKARKIPNHFKNIPCFFRQRVV